MLGREGRPSPLRTAQTRVPRAGFYVLQADALAMSTYRTLDEPRATLLKEHRQISECTKVPGQISRVLTLLGCAGVSPVETLPVYGGVETVMCCQRMRIHAMSFSVMLVCSVLSVDMYRLAGMLWTRKAKH
jgi:hypothetical protein